MPEKPELSFGASLIEDFHAHVYYNNAMGQAHAVKIRESVPQLYEVEMGRQRDESVGPHPASLYQMAFEIEHLSRRIPWLQSVRALLSILLRTRTGICDLTGHNDDAVWPGDSSKLKLDFFNRDGKRA